MAGTIFDLFGAPGLEDEDNGAPFDLAKIDSAFQQAMNDRAPNADLPQEDPAPQPAGVADLEAGASETPPEVEEPAVSDPPVDLGPDPEPEITAASPFADLDAMEQAELLAIRQALADPDRSNEIRRAYLGVKEPVTAAVEAPAVEATLPEEIEPGSFEAQLWEQAQETNRQLAELRADRDQQKQSDFAASMRQAAASATQAFASKYGDKLTQDEIMALATRAGQQKLPDAFLAAGREPVAAMGESLEYVLRSDDAMLGKVLGAPAAPFVHPGDQPQAQERKRALTALSSAAAPSGEVPRRAPLEHREDGRLSEKSRLQTVQDLVNGMNAEKEGL